MVKDFLTQSGYREIKYEQPDNEISQIQMAPYKININTASIDELMMLPGIGTKTAEKIIEFRLKNKFTNIEDLRKINGIGQGKFSKLKNMVCVTNKN